VRKPLAGIGCSSFLRVVAGKQGTNCTPLGFSCCSWDRCFFGLCIPWSPLLNPAGARQSFFVAAVTVVAGGRLFWIEIRRAMRC
jgi:hypothetical protein